MASSKRYSPFLKHRHVDDELDDFYVQGKRAAQRMTVAEMQDDAHLRRVADEETCCEAAADAFYVGAKEMRRELAPTAIEQRAKDELHESMRDFRSKLPPWAD